jgi:hypothetical protein
MLAIGDLVYLDMEERIGVIIKVTPELKLDPAPVDIKVWWSDGQISWCLGEAITVVSSAELHSAPNFISFSYI